MPDIQDYIIPFGKARIWRKGTDLTIVSFGIGMQYALKAADELAAQGIEAEVLDLRTIRPIDYETIIQSVSKTNRCITVEEGFPVASIGNHLSYALRKFDYEVEVIDIDKNALSRMRDDIYPSRYGKWDSNIKLFEEPSQDYVDLEIIGTPPDLSLIHI